MNEFSGYEYIDRYIDSLGRQVLLQEAQCFSIYATRHFDTESIIFWIQADNKSS